jgi:hypothetical protein
MNCSCIKYFHIRKIAPPHIRKWLENHKDDKIIEILVNRKPVQEIITSVLNILSLGEFEEALTELHYDNIFHLYIYLKLENNKIYRLEKNAVVSIKKIKKINNNKDIDISKKIVINNELSISDFISNGEKYQKNFWKYNPKNNNCQNFVESLLLGNHLITKDNEIYSFIKQNSKEIFKRNPKYLSNISKFITNLGGIFDIIENGE